MATRADATGAYGFPGRKSSKVDAWVCFVQIRLASTVTATMKRPASSPGMALFSVSHFPNISAWQIGSAFAIGTSRNAPFPDSSAVEQSTVNRLVASSNLARGASLFNNLAARYAKDRTNPAFGATFGQQKRKALLKRRWLLGAPPFPHSLQRSACHGES